MSALALAAPHGILLVNLGSPDAPDTASVRRYLREFLGDPRVIDIHPAARWLLLNLVILPTRPRKSAEAYRKIWTSEGSPLVVHGKELRDRLRERLGTRWRVELAMRYGNPSVQEALSSLVAQGVGRITVLPLFPHEAASSSGSATEHVYRIAGSLWNVPSLDIVPPFFDEPGYLDAVAERGRPVVANAKPDHVLFSFHGVPERHVLKSDPSGAHCLKSGSCCETMSAANAHCYRAQCFDTARQVAQRLALPRERWTVTFQSRLGRTPWVQPFTDIVVRELATRGVKRLVVFSPAFVADNLETLEEIAMRERASFLEAGGEELVLVPSLNAEPMWVETVARMIEKRLPT